jgi:parafibromin
VAVFVQGVTWQFKDWKYTEPLTLFTHVKGFFPFFQDPLASSSSLHFPLADPNAKLASTWNVDPLPIHKTKRHLDRECLLQFWSALDEWMLSRGLRHFLPKL